MQWLGAQWVGLFLGVPSCAEPPGAPRGGAGAELGHCSDGSLSMLEHGASICEEDVAVHVRELQRGTDRAVLRRLVEVVAAALRPCERASAAAAVRAFRRPDRGSGHRGSRHGKIAKVLALGRALPGPDGGVVLLRLLLRLPHPTPAQRVRLALLSQRPA